MGSEARAAPMAGAVVPPTSSLHRAARLTAQSGSVSMCLGRLGMLQLEDLAAGFVRFASGFRRTGLSVGQGLHDVT